MAEKKKKTVASVWAVRRAVADLIASAGCDCCRNHEKFENAEKRLARMLDVPMFDDKSGYDFYRFMTKRKEDRDS